MAQITAYLVWKSRTTREKRELVFEGTDENFARDGVRRLLEGGEGSFGYVQRDGITVSYITESVCLRVAA
jgi:hypothetical protein